MRTDAQILAQMERRYAELEQQAEQRRTDPLLLYPCSTCHWVASMGDRWCNHPMVKGFGPEFYIHNKELPPLCGEEKALWTQQVWHKRTWAKVPHVLRGVLFMLAVFGGVLSLSYGMAALLRAVAR